MLKDLVRAFRELRDPRVRSVLWLAIGSSIAVLTALILGADLLLERATATGHAWLDRIVEILGVLGTLVIAWLLFPSIVVAVSGLFLERVVETTEDRYQTGLAPPREVPFARSLLMALSLLGSSLLLNLLALPFYLVPLLNLPLWLALNGYLVGREYFELVALRRLDPETASSLRRRHRLAFWRAGTAIACLLVVPVLNLVAPVVGAAFMTLRFHRILRGLPNPV
jgi:CysZ protein